MIRPLIAFLQQASPADTVAAKAGPTAGFASDSELLIRVGLAVLGALISGSLFLWWEYRGRRGRDRWPVAQILYNEVQGNYQTLQTCLNDALALSRRPEDIVNMEPLQFKDAALVSLRERIDVLPRPLGRQVLDLYSSLQRLRELQVTLGRLPKPASGDSARQPLAGVDRRYERVSGDLFRSARTTLELSRKTVVHLYHAGGVQEDLRLALRDPTPRRQWSGARDRRENRVILTRMPLWLYPIVERWRGRRPLRAPDERKAA